MAARIRTLFREQRVTIASILIALGFTISTIWLAITNALGGGAVLQPPKPAPPKPDPPQPDPPKPDPPKPEPHNVKKLLKQRLQDLGRLLAKLAQKAAAALPGIIGSIVSWLLNFLSNSAGWLATNLWALAVALGGLLLLAARG